MFIDTYLNFLNEEDESWSPTALTKVVNAHFKYALDEGKNKCKGDASCLKAARKSAHKFALEVLGQKKMYIKTPEAKRKWSELYKYHSTKMRG